MTYLPLRVRIKLFIKKILPEDAFALVVAVWRKTFSKLTTDVPIIQYYTKDFIAIHGYNVIGGPFAGLRYVKEAAGSSYLIKLIGVYEEVLHPFIEKIKARDYTTIIDIGCAEGYYLIGIGRHLPGAKLIGYDIDSTALALTKKLYDINNLSNKLLLIDACTPEDLSARIDENTFLMCDAEGFEYNILDPAKTKALRKVTTMLIELHDFAVPGIKDILNSRFKETHTVKVVQFKNGSAEHYPYLKKMKNKKHLYALLRERGEQEQEWLILEKK